MMVVVVATMMMMTTTSTTIILTAAPLPAITGNGRMTTLMIIVVDPRTTWRGTPYLRVARPSGTAGAAWPCRPAATNPPTNLAKGRMSCFTLADSSAAM